MSRRHRLPTRSFHCLLFAEDLEWLESRFGLQGQRPVGVGNIIREIVHKRVAQVRAREVEELDAQTRGTTE
jgi:hypothetical protein